MSSDPSKCLGVEFAERRNGTHCPVLKFGSMTLRRAAIKHFVIE